MKGNGVILGRGGGEDSFSAQTLLILSVHGGREASGNGGDLGARDGVLLALEGSDV